MEEYLHYLVKNKDDALLVFRIDSENMYNYPRMVRWTHFLNDDHYFSVFNLDKKRTNVRSSLENISFLYHVHKDYAKIFNADAITDMIAIVNRIQADDKAKMETKKPDTYWSGENAEVFADFISSKGKYVCLCESIHKQSEYYLIDYVDDQNFLIWNVNNFANVSKTKRKFIYDTIRPVTKGYALWIHDSNLKKKVLALLRNINQASHPTGGAGVSSIPVGSYNTITGTGAMAKYKSGDLAFTTTGNVLIHTGNSNSAFHMPSQMTLKPVLSDDAYVGAGKKVVQISTDTEKPIVIKRPKLLQL